VEAASNRISETATMKSVATLVMPQAPRPVAKKVPSPLKGPLAPPVPDDGAVEVAGGAACVCEVGEGEGVMLVAGGGLLWGVLAMAVTAGIVGEGTEEEGAEKEGAEEEGGGRHFAEFRRLTETSEEFEEVEAARAATTRR
jgi:hypothetical protein